MKLLPYLLLLLTCTAQAQPLQTFPNDPVGVKTTRLPNGFTVYLVEDHTTPSVFGAVAVKAGGKYDPADATGMGHYLEHMLFKGTQDMGTTDYAKERVFLDRIDSLYERLGQTTDDVQRKVIQTQINEQAVQAAAYAIPNEFDRLVSGIGGTGLNAFTTEEMIVYHNFFPPNQMEKWMDISAHRFENPVFRLFQSELETVYEEKNRAMDDFAYALLTAFAKQVFHNHPYGQQSVLGETVHLKNPSLVKMHQYYNTYYVANNMALVLCGDFDAEAVLPLVQAKFGKLKSGDVPKYPEYPEAPFQGREYAKGRYTPVKAGLAAFRTVPLGHPDAAALEVLNHLLSNDGQTGYLDQLALDQQLLMAGTFEQAYLDHGAEVFIVVPKLVGQSVANAEQKMLAVLRRLRLGDFEDWQLDAAKASLRRNFALELENQRSLALSVVNAFIEGRTWSEVIAYNAKIEALDKAAIQAVAEKYYGDNYTFLESRMGFPKKEKLEKPGYQAPKPGPEAKSEYARYFETLPEGQPVPRFVDFQGDVVHRQVKSTLDLYHVVNPVNNIFTLELRYGMGTRVDHRLFFATSFMGLIGTDSLDIKAFKSAFARLGTTYEIYAEDNATVVRLQGFDHQLAPSLALIQHLFRRAYPEQKKVAILEEDEKADRKFIAKDPAESGRALAEYVRYGKQSEFLNRLTLDEVHALKADSLLKWFRIATGHACEAHYSGQRSVDEVADLLEASLFTVNATLPSSVWGIREPIVPEGRKVFFLPRKDAIQTQIYFHRDLGTSAIEDAWLVDAFNQYFGGDMSALVFQEVRELRSLAYTAYCPIRNGETPDGRRYLDGYVGCQADKTMEALQVMVGLLTDMPQKPERMDAIRKAITQSAYTKRPGFRYLSKALLDWKRRGYDQDPYAYRLPFYPGLTMERLYAFYQEKVQVKDPEDGLSIIVTGDPRQIDLKALSQYGEVIELKEEDVFSK